MEKKSHLVGWNHYSAKRTPEIPQQLWLFTMQTEKIYSGIFFLGFPEKLKQYRSGNANIYIYIFRESLIKYTRIYILVSRYLKISSRLIITTVEIYLPLNFVVPNEK